MLRIINTVMIMVFCLCLHMRGADRHWTAADGLPTGEIRQIIELGNGQMLVNCEGAFCISDGDGFLPVPCKYNKAYRLKHYCEDGYAYKWQGDSLLWLRDFYRVYLFDKRRRAFRYDIEPRMSDASIAAFVKDGCKRGVDDARLWAFVDSMHLRMQAACVTSDRQSGIWVGTRANGIYYFSPVKKHVRVVAADSLLSVKMSQYTDSNGRVWSCVTDGIQCDDHGRATLYGACDVKGMPAGKARFIVELPDHRFLVCHSLNNLGCFDPKAHTYVSLMDKIAKLHECRYFVGACPFTDRQTAVYTQNGAFLIDTKTWSVAAFPCENVIGEYSSKYNCMLRAKDGIVYVGTQNGLFALEPKKGGKGYECRMGGDLASNCIRSLVCDASGNVWAGTSYGISRITPAVVNLNGDDGVPNISMLERAARLMEDGRLAFASDCGVVLFCADSVLNGRSLSAPVLTSMMVNNEPVSFEDLEKGCVRLSYKQNYIAFQFSSLDYAMPSHTRYRYRLIGVDAKWRAKANAANGLCKAEYSALPPGKYIFEAQSSADGGEWGASVCCAIVIDPPLWLTWWAKLIYAIVAASILFFAVSAYLRQRRKKMEKENDARVNQLFELRENARHQFAESTEIDPRKISASEDEERLMAKMLDAIDAHMEDSDFGVDQLAVEVCMSRSALYAKLRSMLGITPSDFIRNVRLKHAAQLLTNTQLPIGDIAIRIGYSTSKTFSSNFKRAFGVLPSEYRNPQRKETLG